MCRRGPKGSITKAGTDPEPQRERGEGRSFGEGVGGGGREPSCTVLPQRVRKQKGSDWREGGIEGRLP